jgi:protein MpaA
LAIAGRTVACRSLLILAPAVLGVAATLLPCGAWADSATAGSARTAAGGVSPNRPETSRVWGRSSEGRPIVVRRSGERQSQFKVLIVGSIHGDEPQGMRIVDRIRSRRTPAGIDLWTIRTANPDGTRSGTRKNARGVDLNRNFRFRFDPSLTGGYESGPSPFSEPESRTVARISRAAGFDLAIWYHQPWNETLVPCNGTRRVAVRYSRLSGLEPSRGCDGYVPGSAIGWMHRVLRTDAFVVELGPRPLTRRQVDRHTVAALKLSREEAARTGRDDQGR